MRLSLRLPVVSIIGLGLLFAPLSHLLRIRATATSLPVVPAGAFEVPGSPAREAMRVAAFWWVQAVQLADDECDQEREAQQHWDSAAPFDMGKERQKLLALDRRGYARRALETARQAASLAQTPEDQAWAERQRANWEKAVGRSGAPMPE